MRKLILVIIFFLTMVGVLAMLSYIMPVNFLSGLIAFIPAAALTILVNKPLEEREARKVAEYKAKIEETKRRYESGEMSEAERTAYANRQIADAERLYNAGHLTTIQLEAVRKKYSGKSLLLDNMSIQAATAASNKIEVDRAIEAQQKEAKKSMFYNTLLGDAVAGAPGVVIGAAVSAQESAKEAAELQVKKAFFDTLRRDVCPAFLLVRRSGSLLLK